VCVFERLEAKIPACVGGYYIVKSSMAIKLTIVVPINLIQDIERACLLHQVNKLALEIRVHYPVD
jgi:hypothetical protein